MIRVKAGSQQPVLDGCNSKNLFNSRCIRSLWCRVFRNGFYRDLQLTLCWHWARKVLLWCQRLVCKPLHVVQQLLDYLRCNIQTCGLQ